MLVNWPPPGRYLLAVSGGADSMVLLDLMAGAGRYDLIVAHFDHGMREESRSDRLFVQGAAKRYDLPFVYHTAALGRANEATARAARHTWLEQARSDRQALAVVTGHHADDLLETSLLNLARGTGRRGLAPMLSGPILRPLLNVGRAELREYAAAHRLVWRDDETNADTSNPRNFVRHELMPHATPGWRDRYLGQVQALAAINQRLDAAFAEVLAAHRVDGGFAFPRSLIRDLDLPETAELLAAAARAVDPGVQLEDRLLRELALFAKTARPHRHRLMRTGLTVRSGRSTISVLAF
jgi:tRNA(Ile)-lysidine synthetase-like protein